MFIDLHIKYPLLLSDFNETRVFSTGMLETLKYQNSRISVHWQSNCSMRTDRLTDRPTDGQTDVTKLIVSFRNFGSAPKIIGSHKHLNKYSDIHDQYIVQKFYFGIHERNTH
jgi:hypothetical protein